MSSGTSLPPYAATATLWLSRRLSAATPPGNLFVQSRHPPLQKTKINPPAIILFAGHAPGHLFQKGRSESVRQADQRGRLVMQSGIIDSE